MTGYNLPLGRERGSGLSQVLMGKDLINHAHTIESSLKTPKKEIQGTFRLVDASVC